MTPDLTSADLDRLAERATHPSGRPTTDRIDLDSEDLLALVALAREGLASRRLDDEITALVLIDISAGSTCPLCGQADVHRHSPQEIVIYRNGIKRGVSRAEAQLAAMVEAEAATLNARDEALSEIVDLRAQLAASRGVVKAAELYVRADEEGQPWPAPAVSLRAALTKYKEVTA